MKHGPFKKQLFTLSQICFIRSNAKLYTPEAMSVKIDIEPERIRSFMYRNKIRIKPDEGRIIRRKNTPRSSVSLKIEEVPENVPKIDRAAFTNYSNKQHVY